MSQSRNAPRPGYRCPPPSSSMMVSVIRNFPNPTVGQVTDTCFGDTILVFIEIKRLSRMTLKKVLIVMILLI
jgi:hypothetical protein